METVPLFSELGQSIADETVCLLLSIKALNAAPWTANSAEDARSGSRPTAGAVSEEAFEFEKGTIT